MEPEIVFAGGFAWLATRLADLGTRRVLILAAPSRRFVDELAASLSAFAPAVFDGARVHVPIEVVDAAAAALAESGADTIVAIGGGSPIGLGKALRLRAPELRFAALPTTYAGSEMTTMYGVTTGASKQTGRDPRVRPDLIVYDVELTRALPIAPTVQSLLNALAHVVSVMSTASIASDDAAALAAIAEVRGAIDALLVDPSTTAEGRCGSIDARATAQHGASACAAVYERGKPGIQHALAHLLGGALRLDHAALHAVLLPRFVAHVREIQPALVEGIERAAGVADLSKWLVDVLQRAGAPATLTALGASLDAVRDALATRPELPVGVAVDPA